MFMVLSLVFSGLILNNIFNNDDDKIKNIPYECQGMNLSENYIYSEGIGCYNNLSEFNKELVRQMEALEKYKLLNES